MLQVWRPWSCYKGVSKQSYIIVNDQGEYESGSEEEQDDGKFQDAPEEEDLTYCEFETCATLVVAQILSVQMRESENG